MSRAILLLVMLYPHRLLWLGVLLYFLGMLLRRDTRSGLARVVLQRLGVASALEGFLLYALGRMLYRPDLPQGLTIFLFGTAILVGVPAMVVWQLKRTRIVEQTTGAGAIEKRVSPGPRPGWLLVSITAILVMALLGTVGAVVGNFIGPGHREGFEPSPAGQAMGLIAGCLLGLSLVGYAVRQSR